MAIKDELKVFITNREAECLSDKDARARQRERAATRRAGLDREYVDRFAQQLQRLFPGCPQGMEKLIAEHACLKHSGRVGRTAAAKALDEEAIRLAVIAHIRHEETDYDEQLSRGMDRHQARSEVRPRVQEVLARWTRL